MILNVHLQDAHCYEVGEEIWHTPLVDAIRTEAEIIAQDAALQLLGSPDHAVCNALRDRVIADMTAALIRVGDTYGAPDGVMYSLTHEPAVHVSPDKASLDAVNRPAPGPIVEEVLRFEDLPLGSLATRRAVVRWSDGTESEALRWYSDEILICEGDHGNSRLMSSRVEMHGADGWVGARRAT